MVFLATQTGGEGLILIPSSTHPPLSVWPSICEGRFSTFPLVPTPMLFWAPPPKRPFSPLRAQQKRLLTCEKEGGRAMMKNHAGSRKKNFLPEEMLRKMGFRRTPLQYRWSGPPTHDEGVTERHKEPSIALPIGRAPMINSRSDSRSPPPLIGLAPPPPPSAFLYHDFFPAPAPEGQ